MVPNRTEINNNNPCGVQEVVEGILNPRLCGYLGRYVLALLSLDQVITTCGKRLFAAFNTV